jgi:hypothetical protein
MMAFRSLTFLAVGLLACGGGNQHATENPAPGSTASSQAATPSAGSAASTAPNPSASSAPVASAAPAPAHTVPTLEGSIAGAPFHAVAACITGPGKDPATAYVEIYDVKDFDTSKSCGVLPPDKGARKIGMIIAWKDGAQTDASKLKGGQWPELFVMQGTGDPKKFDRKDTGKDFVPKGTISVVRLGAKKGDVGRIKLDLTMGKDKLQGEVDVDVMGDLGSS